MGEQMPIVNVQLAFAPDPTPTIERVNAAFERAVHKFTRVEEGVIIYDDITVNAFTAAVRAELERDGIKLLGIDDLTLPTSAPKPSER